MIHESGEIISNHTDFITMLDGIEYHPFEFVRYGGLADWCDEHDSPNLAFTLRWMMREKKYPYDRRLNSWEEERMIPTTVMKPWMWSFVVSWPISMRPRRPDHSMLSPTFAGHAFAKTKIQRARLLYRKFSDAIFDLNRWMFAIRKDLGVL